MGPSFIRIALVCHVPVWRAVDKHLNNTSVAARPFVMTLEELHHIPNNVSFGSDGHFWGVAVATGD